MFGYRAEEIRKSIEALDRILDQYDGESNQSDGSAVVNPVAAVAAAADKKFALPKVEQAAHMLASCMKAAGNHKLRKSISK